MKTAAGSRLRSFASSCLERYVLSRCGNLFQFMAAVFLGSLRERQPELLCYIGELIILKQLIANRALD
jgi:hypothetical protein